MRDISMRSGTDPAKWLVNSRLRWPTTVTSKQMLTANYKSLTSNSNHSQQIQIAHSKFKSLTANSNRSQQITNRSQQIQIAHSKLQIAHSKFKSPTANSNRSQQIKVAHSKFKSLTANSNCSHQTPRGGPCSLPFFPYVLMFPQLFLICSL